jgi:hypothetical protein
MSCYVGLKKGTEILGEHNCLHLQGRRVPEEGRESMFLEHWYLSAGLHNVASQNTVVFKFATMRLKMSQFCNVSL